MKCPSCGAQATAGGKFCDYCGASLAAPAVVVPAAAVPAAQRPDPGAGSGRKDWQSYWPAPSDPVFHLWNQPPTNRFRWIAFIFPLAWLAGYGALRAAIGLALVFIAAGVVDEVLDQVLHWRWADLWFVVLVCVYSYKVSTNVDRLAPSRGEFNWITAFVFMLAYCVLLGILF